MLNQMQTQEIGKICEQITLLNNELLLAVRKASGKEPDNLKQANRCCRKLEYEIGNVAAAIFVCRQQIEEDDSDSPVNPLWN